MTAYLGVVVPGLPSARARARRAPAWALLDAAGELLASGRLRLSSCGLGAPSALDGAAVARLLDRAQEAAGAGARPVVVLEPLAAERGEAAVLAVRAGAYLRGFVEGRGWPIVEARWKGAEAPAAGVPHRPWGHLAEQARAAAERRWPTVDWSGAPARANDNGPRRAGTDPGARAAAALLADQARRSERRRAGTTIGSP